MDSTSVSGHESHSADIPLLFGTRCLRLFAYGFLSIVLVLYLKSISFTEVTIGWLIMLTMLGDTVISLGMTSFADRVGRRRMLLIGAVLMTFAAALFAATRDFHWLLLAATIGVISPSGNEVGPFLSIEQAALTQLLPDQRRTLAFAWYNLAGSFATATGALTGGWLCELTRTGGAVGADIYRPVIWGYGLFGLILALMFLGVSAAVEPPMDATERSKTHWLGLRHSRRLVTNLSCLFALDAFGGGFIMQSILAYWFFLRFGVDEQRLGQIFFGANLLAGVSSLLAAWSARRFGLINTMVFTHLPSNVLLILVPLMPNFELAVTMLWIRFSISQMDVPARQSYVMAVVPADERAAAAGVTAIARSLGVAIAPFIATWLVADDHRADGIFYCCGGFKIIYDILLYRQFVAIRPPEERSDRKSQDV